MSFKKTLVAVAAGAALLTGVTNSSANSLLFPYFTTANGAQSALAIYSNRVTPTGETLHYVYNYGPDCTHFDGNGKVTANDVLQHSVAAPGAGGYGKAVGSDTSTPFYLPVANTYGFLTVTNKNTVVVSVALGGAVDAAISGDMAIVDPNTGLVTSYAGMSNGLDTSIPANEGNFGWLYQTYNLGFYPTNLVDTSWYGVVVGNMNGAITGNRNWTATALVSNGGVVYDNEEHPFSGNVAKKLTCAGNIALSDLMTTAQMNSVSATGGLIHAVVTPGAGVDNATGVILTKIQTVKAAVGAPFAGRTFLHPEQWNAY
jgi:hypothetical protein